MRSFVAAAAVVLSAVVGCAGASNPESTGSGAQGLGLELNVVSESRVEGTFRTAQGDVHFSSVVTDGILHVKLDRGAHTMTSDVDPVKLTNDLAISDGAEVSLDDRFVLTALATVVQEEIGRDGKAADMLFRQATLWGAHPVGKLVVQHIQADPKRGWTTLCTYGCSSGTRTFYHDGGSHGNSGYSLAYGKNSGTSCRARCGAGCTAVGTSTYTVDCGAHDHCEQHHGSGANAACTDEFTSASDDFTFAGNCSC